MYSHNKRILKKGLWFKFHKENEIKKYRIKIILKWSCKRAEIFKYGEMRNKNA